MEVKERAGLGRTARGVTLAVAFALLFGAASARAATQFLNDGAKQDPVTGVWVLPNKGACFPVDGASITTRPECVATMFPTYTTSAACGTALGSWSSTTNVCLDAVNNSQLLCVDSAASASFPNGVDRKWSNGVCLLTMKGYDRNKVVCANQGGTYGPIGTVVPSLSGGACFGAWVMPDASTFTPPLLNRTGANPSTGDQCLRCHRSDTEWNVNRVRDVDSMVMTGHKNMSRKVTTGTPLLGPSGAAYPTDSSGNAFDWVNGLITIGGVPTSVFWVYDGWFEDPHRPAAIYSAGSANGKPLMSYSCARCHTTGWTSDAVIGPATGNLAKEPEKSFPGVTWDGVTAVTTGKVNLAGGVTGDTNKFASWDLFGITCSRCHGSAVDNASHGGVPAFTAPTGMGTHNNSFTGTSGGGYCTDARFTASAQCTAAGGTWLTTNCSDGVSATQAACVAAGKTWTFASCSANSLTSTAGTLPVNGLAVPQAFCSAPTPSTSYATSAACTAVAGASWTDATSSFATQTACQAANYTWDTAVSKCFTCYVPNGKTASACAAQNFSPLSATFTNAYASDVDSCKDAGGKWTDTKTQRGQVITAVCMGCHRQETGGVPYGTTVSGGVPNYAGTAPGQDLKVGPYHNTVTFPSHFHGNQFLNSPHAKFSSTFDKIATGNLGNGQYGSYFMADGESANTGNGCTGCHDVHKSTYEVANPKGGAVKECTECHAGPYAKDLTKMHHPTGAGTPLELMATEPAAPCVKCHMPGGQHLFRINSDPTYSTFPAQVFANGVTGAVQTANTQADGTFSSAVWIDVNAACGQCHGGGTVNAKTTGSIASGSTTLTVANASGFAPGEAVTIVGAGSLAGQPADFPTFVTSVAGNVVTLVGKATTNVTGATVILNPTKKNADGTDILYFNKNSLAYYAKGIHGDAAPAADNPPTAAGSCSFDGSTWSATCTSTSSDDKGIAKTVIDWGDGSVLSTASPFTHTYLLPGSYTITLKVIDSIGQTTSANISPATPITAGLFNFFSFTGKVFRVDGTTPIAAAQIQVKRGTVLVKSLMSAADGSYNTGTIKPGTYTVTATRAGFTFANPTRTVILGSNMTGQNLVATGTAAIQVGLTSTVAPRPH